MKFACLGFIEEGAWEALSEEERRARVDECLAYDAVLRSGKHFAGGECLNSSAEARTLQWKDGAVIVTDGPFCETKEVLGGILFLEAENLDEAVNLMKKHPGVRMGPFEIRPTTGGSQESEEVAIRALLSAWNQALEAKNLAGMMEHYLPSAVLFDARPPYKLTGREAIQKCWEQCLPYFPESFRSVHGDLQISVNGSLAYVFGAWRPIADDPDQLGCQTWVRLSLGLRKAGGYWKIEHEHFSNPFDPCTQNVWNISDSEVLGSPDPGACRPSAAGSVAE